MHSLIDSKIVESIRTTGKTDANFPDRKEVLETYSIPFDRKAKNAVITGCQILAMLPNVLSSLARVFDKNEFSYTFLSKEYCCGNYLYRPAIKARDDDAMVECRDLSKEFVLKTIEEAEKFDAQRLVIFCSPCYPIYKHAAPDKDIVFYPQAIKEAMGPAKLEKRIDYYAGCYKLHKKFSPVPMDLKSTNDVLNRIEGLDVHRISAPECCFKPDGLAHMTSSVETDMMVHICTGCYGQALGNIPQDSRTKVVMLPELVEMAMA